MNNSKAQKIIKKILQDLEHAGIITNTLVADLKELRPYAVEEKRPVIAKAIRLTYEHIEEYYTFDIPIPEDDPVDEEDTIVDEDGEMEEVEQEETEKREFNADESLIYFINLIKDADNKHNIEEIREYNKALSDYEF
ncbi:hypothetical protein ACFQ3R_01320 [Mesonia ostreae]|uniref:Uncharacterized protein n=1 Tax=Mesonia ostreae TaxID=861110 RepID=A0ABU2KHX0_9FLAO|nr:hypothetical protein [Mesonia ostreae]MDT0294322.1 hypothetical protein [Mesonia ostreae]